VNKRRSFFTNHPQVNIFLIEAFPDLDLQVSSLLITFVFDCEQIVKCIDNSLILHIYFNVRKHYYTYFELNHAFNIWFWNNAE